MIEFGTFLALINVNALIFIIRLMNTSNTFTSQHPPKTYDDRIRELSLGMAEVVYGSDKASQYAALFTEQAHYCLVKVAEGFGEGLLQGISYAVNKETKLPSEFLSEFGFVKM